MSYIANGSLGGGSYHNLLYTSVLFGGALRPFYWLLPGVNWYGFALVATQAASLALWAWMAYSKRGGVVAYALLFACACVLPFYLTFTVVAYIAVAAGTAWLVFILQNNTHTPKKMALAGFFIVWGFCIRASVLLPTLALFLPALLLLLLQYKSTARQWVFQCTGAALLLGGIVVVATQSWRWYFVPAAVLAGAAGWRLGERGNTALRPLFRVFAVVLVCVLGIFGMRELAEASPVESEFRAYTRARAAVLDNPRVPYEDAQTELGAIGITQVDYQMLNNWAFADKGVFSEEAFTQIAEIVSEKPKPPVPLHRQLLQPGALVALLAPLLAAVALAVGSVPKKRWWLLGLSVSVLWLLCAILLLRQRLVARVFVPMSMVCMLQMFLLAGPGDAPKTSALRVAGGLVAAALLCGVVAGQAWQAKQAAVQNAQRQTKWATQVMQFTSANTGTLYIMASGTYNAAYYTGRPVSSIVPTQIFGNVIKSGSGDSFSPRQYAQMAHRGIQDPDRLLMALLWENDVRYLGGNPQLLQAYLQQYAGATVQYEIETDFENGLCVYRFFTT